MLCAACGGGSSPTKQAVERFEVTQVTPLDASSDVPLSEEINVVFSRSLDPTTLHAASFQVVAESGDVVLGTRLVATFNRGLARFLPDESYFPFAEHTIRITPDVRDTNGTPLDRTYEFRFRTAGKGPVMPGPEDVEDLGALLKRGRWFHRMTLLGNNRFLVAGGYGADNQALAQAENLIVPLKESFLISSTLAQPRAAHLQLMLDDGRVLLVGGEASNDPFLPLATCEVFDPDTFTFSPVASMTKARTFAHGTLLADGRVLVTGGQGLVAGSIVFLDDAEIYDPQTDTWTPVPQAMETGRSGHFSGRLANGDALVVGGTPGIPSATRWDQATGLFEPVSPPPSFAHFLGAGAPLGGGRMFVAGGLNSLGVTIYDPEFGFLGGINQLPDLRAFATATAFADGRILIVGGLDAGAFPVLIHSTVDMFFPVGATGRIYRVPFLELPEPTTHHAAALGSDGAIWITGGLPLDIGFAGLRQVTVIHPGTP